MATLLSLCEPNSPRLLPHRLPPPCQYQHSGQPNEAGFVPPPTLQPTTAHNCSFWQHQTQRFLEDWSNHTDPSFLQENGKGRAELLSPYTTDTPAQPFVMWWYVRHIATSASSSATEHDGGLKQAAERTGVGSRKGLPSPAHRLGTDWFCGILFLCFFILLAWQTALSLGLHRSSQVLQLLNLPVPCILTLKWQTGYNIELVLHLLNN